MEKARVSARDCGAHTSARAGKKGSQSVVLLLCPTMRDDRELARLNHGTLTILRHEYASLELEEMAGAGAKGGPLASPLDEVEAILAKLEGQSIMGIISTDDYPGSILACIVAERLGLSGPTPDVNLLCQHKYFSRLAQRAIVPDAVPHFARIDVTAGAGLPPGIFPPFFLKPVKSFFSIGAHRADSVEVVEAARARWRGMEKFFRPFAELLDRYTPYRLGAELLLAEEILTGTQVTLEGYAFGADIHVFGIVDSIMYPGTIAFERFEYPSSLPEAVQEQMTNIARRLMQGIGYCDGMFNIEFTYDPETGQVGIIEINPRMASQFADLYEKVDGYNSYRILLDLALRRRPELPWRKGPDEFAASCVLRTFQDMFVAALPSAATLAAVEARHPGCRIELFAREGHWLSEEMQDDRSYRYACINLGGAGRNDILIALEDCLRRLDFRFALIEDRHDSPVRPARASRALRKREQG